MGDISRFFCKNFGEMDGKVKASYSAQGDTMKTLW